MATTIDEYSLSTVPVEQLFGERSLGHATGFIWKSPVHRCYLVTNWHVVTCRNFETGNNLRCDGGRPDRFRLLINPRRREFDKIRREISIVDEDGNPLWLVHPIKNVDVALVPLPFGLDDNAISLYPINTLTKHPLSVQVGMDVYILGYPFGPELPAFPVWKRGSIASEPQLVRLGRDYLLVDTASRPGMSGAPVIRRSWTNHVLEDTTSLSLDPKPYTKFIGVYSGRRQTKDPNDAQLGLVWPVSFIEEIAVAGKRDSY